MVSTSGTIVFHFPVAAKPAKIPPLLNIVHFAEDPIQDAKVLDQLAFEQSDDENRFQDARSLAEELELLIKTKQKGYALSPSAEVIIKKRDAVQRDLLHYLFYTRWCADDPGKYGKAWFYRTFCEQLWMRQDIVLDRNSRDELGEEIRQKALDTFQQVPGFDAEKMSVGPQTMRGSQVWLEQLDPPVLVKNHFQRRAACSAELFLLALSRSYILSGSEIGMDVVLSPQRRDEICRICLLDPLHFDRMLNWAQSIFSRFVSQRTRASSYGRSVILHKYVQVEDLA